MGPFAQAVTDAVRRDSDCWEANYYKDGGRWPPQRLNTYLDSRMVALGPEFGALVNLTQAIKQKWTPRARFLRDRNEAPQ